MKTYKEKVISLCGDRRLINACKKAGMKLFNPTGAYNGFGYEKLPLAVRISSLSEMRRFNKIKKELETIPQKPVKKVDPVATWARRLAKLTGIDYEEAVEIANEKLEAKQAEIEALLERQANVRVSIKREKLINEKYRSNPLRRIEDEAHARRILAAHKRHHSTAYDAILAAVHQDEEDGFVDRGHAREIARKCIKDGSFYLNGEIIK